MNSMDDVVKAEREAHEKYELETVVSGFTIAYLRHAFDAVCDKENWKNPVNAEIEDNMISATLVAIEFFTGSKARLKFVGRKDGVNKFKVWALGYYQAVGS